MTPNSRTGPAAGRCHTLACGRDRANRSGQGFRASTLDDRRSGGGQQAWPQPGSRAGEAWRPCSRGFAGSRRRLAWKANGARSEKQWLADHCWMSPGEAASRANTARNLDRLPGTAQALTDGAISAEQARVAAQAARDLPGDTLAGLDQLASGAGRAPTRLGCGVNTVTHRGCDCASHRLRATSARSRRVGG